MSLEALMDQLATLERAQPKKGGTYTQDPTLYVPDGVASNVICSVQPANARTQVVYLQRQMRITHTLYFDQDWGALPRDRWVVGDKYYIVVGWYESLLIKDTWTCDCEETIRR